MGAVPRAQDCVLPATCARGVCRNRKVRRQRGGRGEKKSATRGEGVLQAGASWDKNRSLCRRTRVVNESVWGKEVRLTSR